MAILPGGWEFHITTYECCHFPLLPACPSTRIMLLSGELPTVTQSPLNLACSLRFSLFKWSLFPGVCPKGNQSLSTIVRGEFADLQVSEMCSKKAPSSIYTDFHNQCLKVKGAGNKLKPRKKTGITQNCASQVHLWPDGKTEMWSFYSWPFRPHPHSHLPTL